METKNKHTFYETEVCAYLEPKLNQKLDLYFCHSGMENCNPSHFFGPAVRDHYLIHYILDGRGSYTVNGVSYNLRKKDGFLIRPNEVTHYEADKDDPWIYMWIGFKGIKADQYLKYANLDKNNLIFRYDKDDALKKYILDILSLNRISNGNELKLEGLLYLFLGTLADNNNTNEKIDSNTPTQMYISKTIEYISSYYIKNIKVSDMANYVGLNRSYFSNLFKKNLGVSPQEFLLKFRIDKSCDLLKNPNLSIGDVSRSVGYHDQLNFSKIFKKTKGVSPKEYRKNLYIK